MRLSLSCLVLLFGALAVAAPKATQEAVDRMMPAIREVSVVGAVLDAVGAANARPMSPEQMQTLDAQWQAAAGVAPFMKPYLEGSCADALRRARKAHPELLELFVTDRRGGVVCAASRTSDWFQGDETKWQRAWNDGRGATLVFPPEFDESTQSYTVQVSVPVLVRGRPGGTLTVGIRLDAR